MITPSARGRLASHYQRLLLEAAQRGDRHALDELVRRYQPLVYSICARLWLPHGCERSDFVQEGRVALHKAITRWHPARGPFSAFARCCVRNHMLNVLASLNSGNYQLLSQAASLNAAANAQTPSSAFDPVEVMEVRECLDGVIATLPTLTHREHRALIGALDGKSHRQLADEHGSTPKAITTALRRARDKLSAHQPLAA